MSVARRFALLARSRPDAPAVGQRTYAELERDARVLAARLADAGIGRGDVVACAADASDAMITALVGIACAGAVYLPLALDDPPERLRRMCEQARARVLVTTATARPPVAALPVVDVDGEGSRLAPVAERGPRDALYVNFTSGSTGTPKGIVVPNEAVVRLVDGCDYATLGPGARVAQLAPFAFDAVTWEVWGPLLSGGTVIPVRPHDVLTARAMRDALRRERITAMFLTTALFHEIARQDPSTFAGLEALLFGGEAVDPALVRAVVEGGPPERLVHVYGPTEATTFATAYVVPRKLPGEAIPIGRPVADTSVHLVDDELCAVPAGEEAQIAIGGPRLALGYLGQPELTAERFRPDPFDSSPGARLYLTGDRGRFVDGQLVFLGRRDGQVKVRGHRIELEEVEAELRRMPSVRDAAALVVEQDGDRRLAAFVSPQACAVTTFDEQRLRAALADRLPAYMVPAKVWRLDALPLTRNGKRDRNALAVIAGRQSERDLDGVDQLAAIWAGLLSVDQVSLDDDFFALGGHSLLAGRLVARVRAELGVSLPITAIFTASTLREFGDLVQRLRTGTP